MNTVTKICLIIIATGGILTHTNSASAQDVVAADSWGRYITTFELQYKMVRGKTFTYVPKGNLQFMVKGFDSSDKALVQYALNGKNVGGQIKCNVTSETIKGSKYSWVSAYGCMPDLNAVGVTKAGKWTATVGYSKTLSGEKFNNLRVYTFQVKQHKGPSKGIEFHIDQDFHMGEAWIHFKGDGRSVEIFTWFKVSKDSKTKAYKGAVKIHCTVGTKVLPMDDITNSRFDYEFDDYTTGTNGAKSHWQYNYFIPKSDGQSFFKKNPGKYICKILRNGEIDRELHFTIGADGQVVKPACQKGASPIVSAPATTTLIKTVFKNPQDAKFDRNAFNSNGLHGRKSGLNKTCGF